MTHENSICANCLWLQLKIVHIALEALNAFIWIITCYWIRHQKRRSSIEDEQELNYLTINLEFTIVRKKQVTKNLTSHSTDFASLWDRFAFLTDIALFDDTIVQIIDLLGNLKMLGTLLEGVSAHVIMLQVQTVKFNWIAQFIMDSLK